MTTVSSSPTKLVLERFNNLSNLREAEAKALLNGARTYLISYRLASAQSSTKGTYDERRKHLIALIHELNGHPHHVSTSAWLVTSRQKTAQDVLALLKPAVDLAIDYLQVEPVGVAATAGTVHLQS